MNSPASGGAMRLNGHEHLRSLMDEWTAGLAQVLETMTDQRPEVHWAALSGTAAEAGAGPDADVLPVEAEPPCAREVDGLAGVGGKGEACSDGEPNQAGGGFHIGVAVRLWARARRVNSAGPTPTGGLGRA